VIVDATSAATCRKQVRRFIQLLFGSNRITPTHDEYGMYLAKSASLRTADLSRQVGAAIFSPSGEVLTLGSNEVPRFGGGTYWAGDPGDARDHVIGYDPNDRRQVEILVDLLERLEFGKHFSAELTSVRGSFGFIDMLLKDRSEESIANSMIMDLLEFGRIIHAEMSALTDAARNGISVKRGTLYCTTFPCHICAKHIVASGIDKVIYLEPYQKSYASDLHPDSIVVDSESEGRVSFKTFIGISPFRYRDLFERRRKRKSKDGTFEEWQEGHPRPNIELYERAYDNAEERVAANFDQGIQGLAASE
jgi:cytidine deaminase